MQLKEKQQAPLFEIKDLHGKTIKLADLKGKKILLSLYRYASCPFCNLRIHELIKNYDKLSNQGLVILAVFKSSEADIRQYVNTQEPPFVIIPDEKGMLYQKYKIETAWLGFFKSMLRMGELINSMRKGFFSLKTLPYDKIIPADFLINEDLKIEEAYYGKDFGDHLPLSQIYHWLENKSLNVVETI